tara:strand:- start:4029 stop:4928 length:900 start_codon:yes stop_codon:yes gene_type:complete
MNWKKFTGPVILAGVAILIWSGVNVLLKMKYEEGDTLDDGVPLLICGTFILSILMCLGSIVWFAFALGSKTQKTVFLAQNPNEVQHVSVPLAGDSQSTVVPSKIGGGPVSYVREKIIVEKSEGGTSQIVGFMILGGSVVMFVLMIILGFISILMSMGSGLGFSGGTCNSTCETVWDGAGLSMWASLLLFPCGLVALARPWSWFMKAEDLYLPAISREVVVDEIDYGALTVIQLKEKLKEEGLPISGKKDVLISRLKEHHESVPSEKFSAECVNCKSNLRYPRKYSGRIRCPNCQTVHQV